MVAPSAPNQDFLIALNATLIVAFIVLFVTSAYFMVFRTDLFKQEAAIDAVISDVNYTQSIRQQYATNGETLGYETLDVSDNSDDGFVRR